MTRAWIRNAAVVTIAVALTACGGSDDAPAPADPTQQVPATASQSAEGLVGYLNALGAADADAKEPVALDGYEPKTSEDTEPLPLS